MLGSILDNILGHAVTKPQPPKRYRELSERKSCSNCTHIRLGYDNNWPIVSCARGNPVDWVEDEEFANQYVCDGHKKRSRDE